MIFSPLKRQSLKASLHYSFCGGGDFAKAQDWARRCGLLFRRNSCVCLHVCLCVRSINISTLPSSRCLYNTAALLSSCLFLYLPDCFIEVHSDTIYKGEAGREDVFPNCNRRHLLRVSFSISKLGTNLCAVVAKIDELPDWERAHRHSGGETTKARVYRADEHHEG